MGRRNKVCSLQVGDLALILILDHCKNIEGAIDQKPISVEVFGKVKEITDTYVVLYSWRVLHEDQDTADLNSETFTVVKGAIDAAWIITPFDLNSVGVE